MRTSTLIKLTRFKFIFGSPLLDPASNIDVASGIVGLHACHGNISFLFSTFNNLSLCTRYIMFKYLINNRTFFEILFSEGQPELVSEFHLEDDRFRNLVLRNSYLPQESFVVNLELMELRDIISPSDFIIQIVRSGSKRSVTHLPLFKYSNDFSYKNGIYTLDISKREDFKVDFRENYISIKVLTSNKEGSEWSIRLFGEIRRIL